MGSGTRPTQLLMLYCDIRPEEEVFQLNHSGGGIKDPPEYCSFGVHKRISRTEAQIYDNTVKLNQP